MHVAYLTGVADRYAIGADRDRPRDEAIAALHEITRDPVVLGHAMGGFLHRAATESGGWTAAAELLRQAGADEDIGAARRQALSERP